MDDKPTKRNVIGDRMSADDFGLAEYSALREEIMRRIGQIATLENTALVFSGAVWAWVTANTANPADKIVVCLPSLLAILFFVKRKALSWSLWEAAEYVARIERHFHLPEGLGWEHHLKSKGATPFRLWRRLF